MKRVANPQAPTEWARRKIVVLGLIVSLLSMNMLWACAPAKRAGAAAGGGPNAEQEIIRLSQAKWRWMAERKVDTLAALFADQAMFVHMGGSWGKAQELEVIRSGGIHYKHADIQETSVQLLGNTAILLSKIRLVAVVGGNEVTNPFVVTEVYVRQNSAWKLGSLSFTRLLTP